MAVGIRTSTSANSGAAAATTLVINVPTGTTTGDVMVAGVSANVASTNAITSSGWAAVPGYTVLSNGSNSELVLLYRIATASEPASYTFASALARLSGTMSSFTGADVNNPFAGVNGTNNVASTTVTFPATNPQTEVAYGVLFGTTRNTTAAATMGASSGYTPAADTSTTATPFIQSFVQASHTTYTLPLATVTATSATNSQSANYSTAMLFLRADISGSTGIVVEVAHGKNSATTLASTVTSDSFSTGYANDVIYVVGTRDGGNSSAAWTLSSTTGLTFTQQISTTPIQGGALTIYTAIATSPFASKTITLSSALGGTDIIMTVYVFRGVDTTTPFGASNTANATTGAGTASLTTTRNNSWVWAALFDNSTATAHTVGSGQTKVYEFLDVSDGETNTYWRQTSVTATSGTSVTNNYTSPTTDAWTMVIYEILPTASAPTVSFGSTLMLMGV